MIKAILFDLGNVVIPFDFKLAYARLARHCECKPEEVPTRIRATGLVAPFEKGEIAAEPFVRELSAALGLNLTYQEFCDWWSCVFLPETLVPEALLEDLARRYRLMALSNTNPIHFAMVEKTYPLLRHFDDFVLSYKWARRSRKRRSIARRSCGRDAALGNAFSSTIWR